MAEELGEDGNDSATLDISMSDETATFPTLSLVEDSRMEGIEDAAREDIEEDVLRHTKGHAARTLFHQRRGDDDTLNSTRSLYDADVVYFDIHGRRYCKHYYMPNDEDEQTRLQMLNGVYYEVFGKKLTTVPLKDPQKILDVGTGTGEWAMAMGDEYPGAEVIGIDIARIQPTAVPLNVFFEIDDAEEEGGWTWAQNEFDMVHLRYMCGAFADWKHIYKEAFKHLKPGGWIEVIDFDDHKGVLEYFADTSDVTKWLAAVVEGCEKSGRARTVQHLEPDFLRELGFEDVKCTDFDIPLGTWRDDEEGQKTGKLFLVATVLGIEPLCLRTLIEQMGWDYSEIKRLCGNVMELFWKTVLDTERAKGIGFRVKVLTGRKPGGTEEVVDASS